MSEIEEACKSLYKSMKGFGTDETRLIKEIVSRPNGVRQLIKRQYVTMYGKTLEEHIKSEISGHFLDGVLALLEPTDEYEAKQVRSAVKGLGTNEKVLIQTLCAKEGHEIEILKAAYKRLYNRDLEADIAGDTGGDLGKILRSIATHGRPDSGPVDHALAKAEAKELYEAGVGKFFGTDESVFIRILCSQSFSQLNATFAEYSQLAKADIEKSIKDEMSGDLEFACLTIIKAARNKSAYYAEQLNNAMKGLGTKDDDLIRLLVSRAEVDLGEIKHYYKIMYGKSLYDAVKSELSGDYEKLFLTLIGKD